MATINMKRIVADTLANHLSSNIPGLAGKVSAVAAGPSEDLKCLAVKVLPSDFRFVPSDEDEVYEAELDDGKIICEVGQFTGSFTLELYTASPAEREQYEQLILDLFLATEWAPGTVFVNTPAVTVNSYVSLYQPEIKFRLESESWIEEMSFEAKRYCFIEISLALPALVTRSAATIDSLQLWLSESASDAYIIEVP